MNQSEQFIQQVFNCPTDDWYSISFEKIKKDFLELNDEATAERLLQIAKAYSENAVKTYIENQLKESGIEATEQEVVRVGVSTENFLEIADIAAMGFVLIGVFYGYLLKQKEIRDKPFSLPTFFLKGEEPKNEES